ncbi:hypothetical protein RC1_3476 [Rhodospirillum centenum SW]|uniref:Uncharacterized protein n=1 Tax=Rhodospirillum centenum (strain ATCC 51521 / SW) TaxID=414684 RepID=B6IX10_RHOCS|nr:hypothetical protein RC1_3476 [Rhodospirillum centenum SW]
MPGLWISRASPPHLEAASGHRTRCRTPAKGKLVVGPGAGRPVRSDHTRPGVDG